MMKRIMGSLVAGVVIPMLAACANQMPARLAVQPAASPEAGSRRVSYMGDDYRMVDRDGQAYYCKREAVTGSRTQSVETCLTAGQLQAREQNTQRLLRDINDTPGATQQADGAGGRYNNVMTR